MKKKKILIPIVMMLLMVTLTLSGCITPGTEFDTVKIVATVTRNGGDFTISPTGESGMQLHVVTGTLSISALGQDIDQQGIKSTYNSVNDEINQLYTNKNGGGFLGRIKGWWERTYTDGGLEVNSVNDLAISDIRNALGLNFADLTEIGHINYGGSAQEIFNMDSTSVYTMPNYGLGIYTVKIPASCFKNNKVEPGYLVVNDYYSDRPDTGIKITPEGKSTGFVIYDGSDYHIVVLTNEPAFLTNETKTLRASVKLMKPSGTAIADTITSSYSSYYEVYSYEIQRDLNDATTNVKSNIETLFSQASSTLLSAIPGAVIVKGLDSIREKFEEPSKIDEQKRKGWSNLKNAIKQIYNSREDIASYDTYTQSWSTLVSQTSNLHKYFEKKKVDITNGINSGEWDTIKTAYGYKETNIQTWTAGLISSYYDAVRDENVIYNAMDQDISVFNSQNHLENFYQAYLQRVDTASYSGPIMHMQMIDDSYFTTFDAKAKEKFSYLLDLDFADVLPAFNMSDLDDLREDLKTEITTVIEAYVPDYITDGLKGVKTDIENNTRQLQELNFEILELKVTLNDLSAFIKRAIPDIPTVSIFAYQTPSPVFTKIIGEEGDFIQADPTSSFSGSCSVVIGDTTNWSLTTGYPRAVVITQSRGTKYIPLEENTVTGSYHLRRDMVGANNLTVGDIVKTYFEVKVHNTTDNLTATTNTYYTRVEKSWLSEALDRLGIDIDNLKEAQDEVQEAINWLSFDVTPFESGNKSALDPYFSTLTVYNEEGEELYVKEARKNFRMDTYDSEILIWEVRIFQDEPYSLEINVGNATDSSVVNYSTSINKNENTLWDSINPLNWF